MAKQAQEVETTAEDIIKVQSALIEKLTADVALLKAAVITSKAEEAGTELNPKSIVFVVKDGKEVFKGTVR